MDDLAGGRCFCPLETVRLFNDLLLLPTVLFPSGCVAVFASVKNLNNKLPGPQATERYSRASEMQERSAAHGGPDV